MPDSQDLLPDAPRAVRRVFDRQLTAKRAAYLIAGFTLLITVAGGTLAWLIDRHDFPTFGKGLWFALQTVTTVGYGDATPERAEGRAIAAVIMLVGIAFIAVITAAITATLIENARERFMKRGASDTDERLDRMDARLAAIEAALTKGDGDQG